MTASDLGRLAKLRADRAKLHEQRAELRTTARRLSGSPMDGMPRSRGGVNRRTDNYAAKLADLDKEIRKKAVAIIRDEIRVQEFISAVPDARLRLIIRHRVIDEMNWEKVAQAIGQRVETPAGVKQTFLRFLWELDKNPT